MTRLAHCWLPLFSLTVECMDALPSAQSYFTLHDVCRLMSIGTVLAITTQKSAASPSASTAS